MMIFRKVAIVTCMVLSFVSLAFGQSKGLELEYAKVDHWIACKANVSKEIFAAEASYRDLTYNDVYYELAKIAEIAELEYWEGVLPKIWKYCAEQDNLADMTSDKFLEVIKELILNPQCFLGYDEIKEVENLFTN